MRKLYCKFNLFILRVPAIGTSDSKKINVLTPFNLKEKGLKVFSCQLEQDSTSVGKYDGSEKRNMYLLLLLNPRLHRKICQT